MRRVIFDSLSFICLWLRSACARLSNNRDVAKIKVGTHLATSCSNTLQRQVAATNRVVCAGKFLWKSLSLQHNFVAATSRKKSNQTEFVRLVAATKLCCRDKHFHKNSPTHTKGFVAATCRRNVLLQVGAGPVHME